MAARSLAVSGMTCDHCASAVRAEISKLPGDVPDDIVAAVPELSVRPTLT